MKPLLAAAALLVSVGPVCAESAVYSCTDADGRTALSNTVSGAQCVKLFSGPDAAPAAAPLHRSAAGPASAGLSQAMPADVPAPAAGAGPAPTVAMLTPPAPDQQPRSDAELRQAQRRDAAIRQASDASQSTQPQTGINRAVGRRYLAMSRAQFLQAFNPPLQ